MSRSEHSRYSDRARYDAAAARYHEVLKFSESGRPGVSVTGDYRDSVWAKIWQDADEADDRTLDEWNLKGRKFSEDERRGICRRWHAAYSDENKAPMIPLEDLLRAAPGISDDDVRDMLSATLTKESELSRRRVSRPRKLTERGEGFGEANKQNPSQPAPPADAGGPSSRRRYAEGDDEDDGPPQQQRSRTPRVGEDVLLPSHRGGGQARVTSNRHGQSTLAYDDGTASREYNRRLRDAKNARWYDYDERGRTMSRYTEADRARLARMHAQDALAVQKFSEGGANPHAVHRAARDYVGSATDEQLDRIVRGPGRKRDPAQREQIARAYYDAMKDEMAKSKSFMPLRDFVAAARGMTDEDVDRLESETLNKHAERRKRRR